LAWRAEAFGTGQDFLRKQLTGNPSCLVLDVRLPQLSGLDFQLPIGGDWRANPHHFYYGAWRHSHVCPCLEVGCRGIFDDAFRDQDLLDAIQQAFPRDSAAREQQAEIHNLHARYHALTARKREVMTLVVTGMLNKQIAYEIGASEATVKIHRGHVMQKMEAGSLVELVRMADWLKLSSRK
jgi:FixJ family two-component response regulator